MATLRYSDKILFNEQFSRKDIVWENQEKNFEVDINIAVAFQKQENSPFVLREGSFNIKVLARIKDTSINDYVVNYLAEYSFQYEIEEGDLTEREIINNSLIDRRTILDSLKRIEDTLAIAGLGQISISDRL